MNTCTPTFTIEKKFFGMIYRVWRNDSGVVKDEICHRRLRNAEIR